MAKLEKFRPQLKPGQIIPQGERLIYETEAPLDQIILPIENIEFLLLCDGQNSVGDIIDTIYKRKGAIQFKSIFRTLNYLKHRGFLENGDDLEINSSLSPIDDFNFLTTQPIFEVSFGKRIFNEKEHPLIFYFLSIAAVISTILSLPFANKSWLSLDFLNIHNSFWQGFVFFIVGSSVLLSLKGLFKCALLIFLTGRAYNFSLIFNGVSLYFRVRSDSLFLVVNRLYLFLFHLAVVTSYIPIVGTVYFFFPSLPYQNEAMSLAFLLFILDLHPFQDSEMSYLVKSIFNNDTINKMSAYMKNRPLLSLIHPFERGQEYNVYFFFTHFALLWSGLMLFILEKTTVRHWTSLIHAIKSGPLVEKGSALLFGTILICLGYVVANNSLRLIYNTLFMPISAMISDRIRSYKSQRLEFFNSKEILKILENLPLFNYFSIELLNMIISKSEIKEYKTGAPVIVQGEAASHLYILLGGFLQVRSRLPAGRVKEISEIFPLSIFGEIAVIEETTRMAEVVALKDSVVLEIPARLLRKVAEESQYIREIESFRNAIVVNQFFTSAPMFRELPETICQLFITKGKIETFSPDQVVFKQGDKGDGFFLLLRGSVGVHSVNGQPISRIKQGGFFGEVSMIADVPRTATIYSIEPVQVLS